MGELLSEQFHLHPKNVAQEEQNCLISSFSAGNSMYLQEKLLQEKRCWKKGGSKEQTNKEYIW